jgi:hypothetical protein
MTPNWQSPAYALFARRPIVPQPPYVLAADPPASQEPLPPSGTEDTPVTDCPLSAVASAPIVKRPRQKAAAADSQSVPVLANPMNRDSSSPVYPRAKDGVLNESALDRQPIAHLNVLGGR